MQLRYRPGFLEQHAGDLPDGYRVCDAAVLITSTRRPDGGLAYEVCGQSGGNLMSDDDMFLAFTMLADVLRTRLPGWRRQVAQTTHDLFRYGLEGQDELGLFQG
jgi:hypothetical protein